LKRITIVSRHYPPNKNINGVLANEMAKYLIEDSTIEVNICCIDNVVEGNTQIEKTYGNITRVNQKFKGKSKVGKLLNLILDGYLLIKKSKKIDSDLIICTTSPPLLPFWASLMLKKRKWALWSLDLFPEGFVAAGTLKESNLIYRYLKKKTYKNLPCGLIALGEKQADHILKEYKQDIKTIILPAGVNLNDTKSENNSINPDWYNSEKIILGYLGNVGQAHNPDFIKKVIEITANFEITFVLSVYGIHGDEMKLFAKSFQHVVIIENGLPQEFMKLIDVHLISLRREWTHIAVPSKAVTAISEGRPIVFCGSEESDNWQMFKDAGWLIPENEGMEKNIDLFIKGLNRDVINQKAKNTSLIISDLRSKVLDAYKKIGELDF
jgi:hypothetical protein